MTGNMPLVSVIMNCYNGEKYLKEAIDSVLAQTYTNYEIIFWDNVSTDNSRKIVESYNDKRIKYFLADKHVSLGESRNLAIEKSNGKYLAFLDSDDWWKKTKLEKTLIPFKDNKIGIVYTNGYTFYEKKARQKKFYKKKQKSGWLFEDLISNYQVMVPSVMIRKKALTNLTEWFDTKFSMIEEFDLLVRISKNWKVAYIHESLCFWRAHASSLTWSKKEEFEIENTLFLSKIVSKYPSLKNTFCIKRFKAKIAYHGFLNKWKKNGLEDRDLILPYLFVDYRLMIIFFLSFFPLKIVLYFLRNIGKEI